MATQKENYKPVDVSKLLKISVVSSAEIVITNIVMAIFVMLVVAVICAIKLHLPLSLIGAVCTGVLAGLIPMMYVSPDAYETILLTNKIDGSLRSVRDGLCPKYLWEWVKDKFDQRADIKDDIEFKLSTKRGGIQGKFALTIKFDAGKLNDSAYSKSLHAATFGYYTEEAKIGMMMTRGLTILREIVNGKPATESIEQDDLGKEIEAKLQATARSISATIKKAELYDFDFTAEAHKFVDNRLKAQVFTDIIKIFEEQGGYSNAEARAIAPYFMDDVKLTKEVQDVNINVSGLGDIKIPKELVEGVIGIFKSRKKK